MLIIPVYSDLDSSVIGYRSETVSTTVGGKQIHVCDGYIARTREEIIRLAVLNANVRHMAYSLARKFASK